MSRKVQKIMFHLNSLGKGGAERVVSLLSERFAQEGYRIVIATEWTEAEEYPLSTRIRRIDVGLGEQQAQASRWKKQWIRVKNLEDAIRTEQPDVLFSFCVKANYRATMAAWGKKIPVIISVRNDPKVDYTGRKNAVMTRLFLNGAAGCVFQTQEAKEFFAGSLQKKSVIICNPVNEKFLQAERKLPAKKIVCVGRLVKQKNQMLLLKAFENVLRKYPQYELYFYGDGSQDACKDILTEYVQKKEIVINAGDEKRSLCLKAAVHFMGVRSDLETELADAAMFVLPSDYEGMPNALMEAMALGLPSISTDCPCGGSRYWIEHGKNGLLFPVGDTEALTESMLWVIGHPKEAEAMGQRARKTLQSAALDRVYAKWKAYMEDVAEKQTDSRKKGKKR